MQTEIKLDNGVTLGRTMRESGGYAIDKSAARRVFNGKAKTVVATCRACTNHHSASYAVIRNRHGQIAIGCKEFSVEDIKVIRRWVGQKPRVRKTKVSK